MDETDLLTILLIVVAIVGPIGGAVVGYFLGRRGTARDSAAASSERRSSTALALLGELSGIKRRLDEGYQLNITAVAAYWNGVPELPTATYDELRGQGRVAELGPDLAAKIHGMYDDVRRINSGANAVNKKLADSPGEAQRDPTRVLGNLWFPVSTSKSRFVAAYSVVERALKGFVTPATSTG